MRLENIFNQSQNLSHLEYFGQYLMHSLMLFASIWFLAFAFGIYKVAGDNYLNTFLSKRRIFVKILAIYGFLKIGYEFYVFAF